MKALKLIALLSTIAITACKEEKPLSKYELPSNPPTKGFVSEEYLDSSGCKFHDSYAGDKYMLMCARSKETLDIYQQWSNLMLFQNKLESFLNAEAQAPTAPTQIVDLLTEKKKHVEDEAKSILNMVSISGGTEYLKLKMKMVTDIDQTVEAIFLNELMMIGQVHSIFLVPCQTEYQVVHLATDLDRDSIEKKLDVLNASLDLLAARKNTLLGSTEGTFISMAQSLDNFLK